MSSQSMSSETGFWNFRFKLILLIALLMAGTLSVQAVIRNHSIQVILDGTEEVAGKIANEAAEKIVIATSTNDPASWNSGGVSSAYFQNNSRLSKTLELNALEIMRLSDEIRSQTSAQDSTGSMNLEETLLDMVVAFQPDLNSSAYVEARKVLIARSNSQGTTVIRKEEYKPERYGKRKSSSSAKNFGTAKETSLTLSFATPELGEATEQVENLGLEEPANSEVPSIGDLFLTTEASSVEGSAASESSPGGFSGDPDNLSIDLKVPLQELAELVRQTNERDLLATLSVFMIGLALAWILGSRLVKPVTEVVEGMQKVAAGDMSVRLSEQRDVEFALINGHFNEMVQQLENARSMERGLEHRERLQTMGDLAAGVAHDIRNPLSAISMIVGRLGFDYAPTDAKEREEFLSHTKDIKDEIERLNNLVSDFLQLAQPNSQDSKPCQVGDLLQELHRLLDKEAADQNVSIQLDIQEDLSLTRWNPVEGKSAFLNVAMNAIQAMQSTGGSLTIQARSDDHWIVVAFKDDGPGIAREDCEQVLLPYVTRRPGGTGLGLAIARRVAERYGGRLELTSQLAVGTEVRFLLPVLDEQASA